MFFSGPARAQFAQLVQEIVSGFLVVPVIAGVVDFDREAGNFGGSGCFIESNFVGENGPPAGPDKSWVVGFGSFFERVLAEEIGGRGRELGEQIVFGGDALAIVNAGGVGHGRAGGERVGRGVGHVGDEDRNLLRGIGSLGKASTFDGGEMLADGIDLGDGRAGVN